MTKIRNLLIFRRQRGIGLLELMLSLAIIAILLVMATRYYLTASLASDVNEVVSNLQGVTACFNNWRQAYMQGTSAKTLANFKLQDCVDNGWFPKAITTGDNQFATPWGTATITPTTDDITVSISTGGNTKATQDLYLKLGGTPGSTASSPIIYSIVQQELTSLSP